MSKIRKRTNTIRVVLSLTMSLGCYIPTSEAGGSWFQAERLRLIDSLDQTLIQNKACVDKNDCINEQLIFVAGEPWGLDVSVYGISDGRVLTEFVNSCSDMFFSSVRNMNLKVTITRVTKREDMATAFWNKAKTIEITFHGDE